MSLSPLLRLLLLPFLLCSLHAEDRVVAPAFTTIRVVTPPPQPNAGRYVGLITVTEKVPTLPAAVILPNATPKEVLTQRRTERIVASVHGGRIRLLAPPGSSILGVLDEPNFATVSLKATYVPGSPAASGTSAEARKGSGDYTFNADRVRLSFQVSTLHLNFAAGDQEVTGNIHVRIDLTRVDR